MPWPNFLHSHLSRPYKSPQIKGLLVCNSWDISVLRTTIKIWLYVVKIRSRGKKYTFYFYARIKGTTSCNPGNAVVKK